MPPKTLFLLLDIDNTLYDYDVTGFGQEMHDRIYEYAQTRVGISLEEAKMLSKKYFNSYGLSLHGYVKEYRVDDRDYSDFVHQCSYHKLRRNAPLVDMLTRLQRRPPGSAADEDATDLDDKAAPVSNGRHHLYFFTNASRSHARRVLEPLGLKKVFSRARPTGSPVVDLHKRCDPKGFERDVEWRGFAYEDQWQLTAPETSNKPMREVYPAIFSEIRRQILQDEQILSGEVGTCSCDDASPNAGALHADLVLDQKVNCCPENMVMVDDSLVNLRAPIELGWRAVWHSHGQPDPQEAIYAGAIAKGQLKVIRNVLELEDVIRQFSCEE